jgi:hypothetical protein
MCALLVAAAVALLLIRPVSPAEGNSAMAGTATASTCRQKIQITCRLMSSSNACGTPCCCNLGSKLLNI